ncbi:MAG TPA: glycosyltransferase family 4 protein [Microvirga sp.]|nr:glycosyltransferase family 4 protein [Microvirga sp.]
MAEVIFAIPGDLAAPTGGYAYARRVLDLMPEHGIAMRHLALPGGYPDPSAEDFAATARLVADTAPDAVLLVDGLAFGAMPEDLVAGFGRRIVALVHHPLAHETGLPPERRAALHASEARALALAHRVVAASPLTARLLAAEYGVPTERIAVAEPGTDPAPRSRGTGSPVQLLAVGAVSPRKGFEVLVRALAGLADPDWRLTIAGATDRDPAAVAALGRAIAESGVAGRIRLAGEVDDAALEELYDRADVFVSASLFEGYGMVLAEAMARGLPLVASTGGAADDTVSADAALKVPPGDVGRLAAALRRVVGDPALRRRLAEGAWAAGQRLPTWSDTAARIARTLREAAR